MSLQGRRVAYCEEFGGNEQMADERIKALTGGGKVRARQLNHPEVQFEMTCGFVLASNKKPLFETVDQAILRRLVMVPCETMFRDDTTEVKYDPQNPQHRWRDPNIVAKLNTDEGKRQLLAWLAKGAHAFYSANSTRPPHPPSISAFGRQLQQEQDLVGQFVKEVCDLDASFDVAKMSVYNKHQPTRNGPPDHRYLYLAAKLADDFKELHGVEFSTLHKHQLLHTYGVGQARLRNGYSSAQSFFVGLRERIDDDEVGNNDDGDEMLSELL
jgi:phage/plasmid-associated DNA primase